ncbi:MAG: hypothetical protein V1792_28685 [Pseudomonadota bacterium]
MMILKNARVHLAQFDLTSDLNQVNLNYGAAMQDGTVFLDGTRINKPGLYDLSFNHAGFVQYGAGLIDETLFNKIGASASPMSVVPEPGGASGAIAAADRGFLSSVVEATYTPGGPVGDLLKFGVTGVGAGYPLVRGLVLEPGVAERTVTGTGTIVLGVATSATQYLYGLIHVTSFTAGTLAVIIQSAAAVGFSGPSTRITFDTASARTSQFAVPVAGGAGAPYTDTYYRVSYTIAGGGTWKFLVLVGVQ